MRPGLVQPLTYSLAEAAVLIPCTERWLADRLRDGTFGGRKIQRQWRLTQGDIDAIIGNCLASGTAEREKRRPPAPARESTASYRRAQAKAK